MKKLTAGLLAAALALSLAACGPKTCKEEGCELEAYKDGYCELHYALYELDNMLGGLFQ